MSVHDSDFLNKTLLRSFVPLSRLTDDQLDLMVEKSERMPLYKGQTLVKQGESNQHHLYLIHGNLKLESDDGEAHVIQAGEKQSYQAIAHDFPRKYTVTADSDCSVLKVDSDFLEKLICWGQVARCLLADIAMDQDLLPDYFWIKKLLESKLFYKVPPTNIRHILDKFNEVKVFEGNRVINEGDEGTCCYLLKAGIAEVYIKDAGKDPVAVLGSGAVFGEDALVTNNPRNASIIMKSDGYLLKLEKQDFYRLLTQPAVTMVTPGNIEGFLNSGAQLIDVRTETEFELGHHKQAINVPLNLVYLKSSLLDREKIHITYSPTEERARAAAYLLSEQGIQAYALQAGTNTLSTDMTKNFQFVD